MITFTTLLPHCYEYWLQNAIFFLHFSYINEILLKYAKKLGGSISKSKQIPEKRSRNRRKSLKDASYNTTLMKKLQFFLRAGLRLLQTIPFNPFKCLHVVRGSLLQSKKSTISKEFRRKFHNQWLRGLIGFSWDPESSHVLSEHQCGCMSSIHRRQDFWDQTRCTSGKILFDQILMGRLVHVVCSKLYNFHGSVLYFPNKFSSLGQPESAYSKSVRFMIVGALVTWAIHTQG